MKIYYATFYGSTKQYAEALATRLGVEAEEFPSSVPEDAGPIVVLSPIHGPMHPGVAFIKELPRSVGPVCLATVGMTLDDVVVQQDPAADLLGKLADSVERFYLPGRLNYSELSPGHRRVMKGLIGMLKLKPGKNVNEQMMIDTYGKDVDRVDLDRLGPIVEWATR